MEEKFKKREGKDYSITVYNKGNNYLYITSRNENNKIVKITFVIQNDFYDFYGVDIDGIKLYNDNSIYKVTDEMFIFCSGEIVFVFDIKKKTIFSETCNSAYLYGTLSVVNDIKTSDNIIVFSNIKFMPRSEDCIDCDYYEDCRSKKPCDKHQERYFVYSIDLQEEKITRKHMLIGRNRVLKYKDGGDRESEVRGIEFDNEKTNYMNSKFYLSLNRYDLRLTIITLNDYKWDLPKETYPHILYKIEDKKAKIVKSNKLEITDSNLNDFLNVYEKGVTLDEEYMYFKTDTGTIRIDQKSNFITLP